jgi:hypothetical protein
LNHISRRPFLQKSSTGGASRGIHYHQTGTRSRRRKSWLKAGLIGYGGRGTQAVVDMMRGPENTHLVAMGDLFEDQLEKVANQDSRSERLRQLQGSDQSRP